MDIEVVKDPSGMWRIMNAPIISTGIEYPLMTGPKTFTESELVSAVAAQRDPAIVAPRIKLGHTSGYNEALVGDAEQAFGRIDKASMIMGDNNQTIFGDYLVPEWLGTIMPIAFPNRSIEGNGDVETVTGKDYELVITAVSLLGIYWPGCQVLEDLPLWYGGDIPDGVEFDEAIAAKLASSNIKVTARGGKMPDVMADADISRIRRQFYDRAMSNELDGVDANTYWWWVRGERLADDGGLYLIVEDDENGDLYKFGVTVSTEDVTFSEPTQVRVEYVNAAAARDLAAVVAGMAAMDPHLVVYASRADTGGPDPSTQEGASSMDEVKRKKLAASCGLPEGATEEQIKVRLKQIRAEADDAGVSGPLEGEEPEDGEERQPNEQRQGEGEGGEPKEGTHQTPPGTAPSGTAPGGTEPDPEIESGIVRLDKETYQHLKAGADAALANRQQEDEKRQLGKVSDAVKAGKIPPARRKHYATLMAADEEGTTALLDSLQPGLIPVEERGSLSGGDEDNVNAANGEGLPDPWFPEIAEKRLAASQPRPVITQAKEG